MRDRLIELLKMVEYQYIETHSIMTQNVADFLLQRGVIVPPCKVGDKVYVIHNTVERIELGLKDCIYETEIDAIHITGVIEYHLYYKKIVHPDCDFFTEKDIGKTVFFTKEEALCKLQAS